MQGTTTTSPVAIAEKFNNFLINTDYEITWSSNISESKHVDTLPLQIYWQQIPQKSSEYMGLLPDTSNCGLNMCRECRERFPRHRLQRNRGLAIPACSTARAWPHVPWYMPGSLTHGGRENVPGIPGACATRNVTYLAKAPLPSKSSSGTDRISMYLLVYLSLPLTHLHLAPHICVN